MARVVVLDSGVDLEHPVLKNNGEHFSRLTSKDDISDAVGHGTAVCSILLKNTDNIEIIVGKILNKDGQASIEQLIESLKYIYDNIDCQIINLSLGVLYPSIELEAICELFFQKGVILVSAFDNAGAVSYPAAYTCVIGVDSSPRCTHADDFVFVKGSIVNIKAKGGIQRLPWSNSQYILTQGSSFAAPYVTAAIVNMLDNATGESLSSYFENQARYVYNFTEVKKVSDHEAVKSFKNTAVFPYNKEIHSLVNFSELLNFNIVGVYDTRYSRQVGTTKKTFSGKDIAIQSINDLDYTRIDSIIIGHINEVELLSGSNLKEDILLKCLENNVNVFCFDRINTEKFIDMFRDHQLTLDFPYLSKEMIPNNKFGKLHQFQTPILGVYGTTKQQGKYTLQLELRKRFLKEGYHIAQLGTEPSAPLFGMDVVYPFGYSSTVEAYGNETIETVNALIHSLDEKSPDLILTGCQSGTVPMLFDNMGEMPTEQLNFLLGTNPDAVILCVNYLDELKYISRTIKVLEGLVDTKVIAISMFPAYTPNGWFFASGSKKQADPHQLLEYKQRIEVEFNIPSYILGNENEVDGLYERCIEFFSD